MRTLVLAALTMLFLSGFPAQGECCGSKTTVIKVKSGCGKTPAKRQKDGKAGSSAANTMRSDLVCGVCGTKMAVKQRGDGAYCSRHFCDEHQLVRRDGACPACKAQHDVRNGNAKCAVCGTKRGLSVCVYGPESSGVFCKEHFCRKHNMPFAMSKSGELECADCARDEKRDEKLAKKEQREKTKQAKELASFLGVEFGNPAEAEGEAPFTPEKTFRNFNEYSLWSAEGGTVDAVIARMKLDSFDGGLEELEAVKDVLEMKYAPRKLKSSARTKTRRALVMKFGGASDPDARSIALVLEANIFDGAVLTLCAGPSKDVLVLASESLKKDAGAL